METSAPSLSLTVFQMRRVHVIGFAASPSLPPLSGEGDDVEKKKDYLRPMTIPVSPAFNPPRLLRPISYVL